MRCLKITVLGLFSLWLIACSSNDDQPSLADQGEKKIYDTSQKQIKSGGYVRAVQNLQLLEARYPFGRYAEQAQLELIYAHYKSFDHEAAVAAAERFIRLHPRHPNVDYAYYMKGLASFTEGAGFMENFLPTDLTKRDPGPTRQSFNDFSELLARFPDSNYAPDAKARMVYLRNLLARYEINVANYYFKRKAFLAAANRGRYVVENFQQTPAVPDGLAVMIQAYQLLGLNHLANDSLQVLTANYPNHPSLDKNGNFVTKYQTEEQSASWLNKLTFGFMDRNVPPEFDSRALYE